MPAACAARFHEYHAASVPARATLLTVQTGWGNFFCNLLFWVLVLGSKFAFDWFALMKPLKKPVIALRNFDWLKSGDRWGDGDVILIFCRCLPSFIVMMNDAQVGARSPALCWPFTASTSVVDGADRSMKALGVLTPRLHLLPTHHCLQVFYLIFMALWGSIKGIVQLNLGSVSTFQVG